MYHDNQKEQSNWNDYIGFSKVMALHYFFDNCNVNTLTLLKNGSNYVMTLHVMIITHSMHVHTF